MSAPGGQRWDPERYARTARFVSELGMPLVELLAPRAGERVLDLGCGDGVLTEKLVALGCEVVAIDTSPAQVEAARGRGLDARVGDGERLGFEAEFDAVFSNAALHWMKRTDAVIRGVWRALRPGGRFVAELGGAGCVAEIERALLRALERRGVDGRAVHPWTFPTEAEYRERLESQGFRVRSIALFPRPTPLPGDVTDWLGTFAQSFLRALPENQWDAFLEEVREALRGKLLQPDGTWVADYVRLRVAAERPA